MSTTWETEFSSTTPDGKELEYQTQALANHNSAERPDRVRVSGKVVHRGWVSDGQGFRVYKDLIREEPS